MGKAIEDLGWALEGLGAVLERSGKRGARGMLVQVWANLFEFFVRRSSMPQLLAGIRFERGVWEEFFGPVRAFRAVREMRISYCEMRSSGEREHESMVLSLPQG